MCVLCMFYVDWGGQKKLEGSVTGNKQLFILGLIGKKSEKGKVCIQLTVV